MVAMCSLPFSSVSAGLNPVVAGCRSRLSADIVSAWDRRLCPRLRRRWPWHVPRRQAAVPAMPNGQVAPIKIRTGAAGPSHTPHQSAHEQAHRV